MNAFNPFDALTAQSKAHREFCGYDLRERDLGMHDGSMPPDDRFPPISAYEDDAEPAQQRAAHFGDATPRPDRAAGFRFVPVGDLEYRAPEYVVDGLIETSSLGMIFGDPGCGKSFLAADLALCVASGAPFHGRKVKRGPVLFIAGEGHNGLTRRFAAWSKERNTPLKGLPMFKSERAAQFLDAASAQAVADAADALAEAHGAPRLVIIDTLARNFGAGDENNTQDMSNFIVAMDDLKARYPGCVVLIVHHSGHAEKNRARGAMALKGALDFEYRMERDGNRVQVCNTKMKDAEPPADLHFTLETVHLADEANSAVLRSSEAPKRQDRLTPSQKLALATYEAAAKEHGIWDGSAFRGVHVDHWRDAFYAKHTGDNYQAKKKAFQRARADMASSGAMDVRDDVYLAKDGPVQTTILTTATQPKDRQGDTGTQGDIEGTCPPAEVESRGTWGTHPLRGVPLSPSDCASDEMEDRDKVGVPLSRPPSSPAMNPTDPDAFNEEMWR